MRYLVIFDNSKSNFTAPELQSRVKHQRFNLRFSLAFQRFTTIPVAELIE